MPQLKIPLKLVTLCLTLLLLGPGSPWLARAAAEDVTFPESRLAIESAEARFEFHVELALTPRQRARGLMFRTELPQGRGMVFDFGAPRLVSMWMRNTYIPLDMLFVDEQGRITRIEANTRPLSEETISSGGPVRAVIELRGGTTQELGIRPGDRVVHPLFSEPRSSG